jgi:hypothetical protein
MQFSPTSYHFIFLRYEYSPQDYVPPIPMPFVTFRNKFNLWRWVYSHTPSPPTWTTNPCRLYATDVSIYSHLPFTSGCRFLHPQTDDTMNVITVIMFPNYYEVMTTFKQKHNYKFENVLQ